VIVTTKLVVFYYLD